MIAECCEVEHEMAMMNQTLMRVDYVTDDLHILLCMIKEANSKTARYVRED